MDLIGSNPNATVAGQDRLPGTSNYFYGNDPSQWHTRIAQYGQVEYQDVYQGINLIYYGNQQQLEYDFQVAPGADPSGIRFAVQGAENVSLDAQGDLVLQTPTGEVVQHAPVMYQTIDGARQAVAGKFLLFDQDQVGFQVGSYDASLPLTIDPILTFSTYLGGSGADYGYGIAVDASGDPYVTGSSPQGAFVTKLNPSGSAILYTSYFGPNGSAYGIAVDSSGNAYITGSAGSGFPTTTGAYQRTYSGSLDAFVSKLSADGSTLLYSTYLGSTTRGYGIAVDSSGDAYVTGITYSSIPTTSGALQTTSRGGGDDGFVTKLNAGGTGLVYSTYLGGSDVDAGQGIAVDSSGDAYVTGYTGSTDFPVTSGGYQRSNNSGTQDAFVVKLNPSGSGEV